MTGSPLRVAGVVGRRRVMAKAASPPDVAAGNLPLLAQEGITNSFKRHPAGIVTLLGRFTPASVSGSIKDDGCGFDPESALGPQSGHFVLHGMKEGVKRLGGKLIIISVPGAGTTVTAYLRQ